MKEYKVYTFVYHNGLGDGSTFGDVEVVAKSEEEAWAMADILAATKEWWQEYDSGERGSIELEYIHTPKKKVFNVGVVETRNFILKIEATDEMSAKEIAEKQIRTEHTDDLNIYRVWEEN